MIKKVLFFLIIQVYSVYLVRGQEIRIGIISDDLYLQYFDVISDPLMSEIQQTVGQNTDIVFDENRILSSKNDKVIAANNYLSLSSNSDVILAFGPVSVQAVLDIGNLKVPTIGIGSIEMELLSLPLTDNRTSGMTNFTYIKMDKSLFLDALSFYELFPYKHLSILVHPMANEQSYEATINNVINNISDSTNATIEFVPVSRDIENSLKSISTNSDAVLIAAGLLTNEELSYISTYLISNKLPSYSRSNWHVNNGILSSKYKSNDLIQLYRKTAIMIDDIKREMPVEDMNVFLESNEEWFINMTTARKINFYPRMEYLFSANLVTSETNVKPYSLQQIIQYAIEKNLDIKISQKDIELSDNDLSYIIGNYLPTLDFQALGTQINEENAFFGTAEKTISGSLSLQQVLYSEEVIAGIKIQKYLNNAQRYAYGADLLEVLLNTCVGYFNVLSAKSNLVIQKENLNVSKRNLELAKIRVSVGFSTQSDVYRWESEVANAQQAVIDAGVLLYNTKLNLNNFLGNSLLTDFQIKDIQLDDSLFVRIQESRLSELITEPGDLKVITDFLVNEALSKHPTKLQLLETIHAVERQHTMNKRMFFLPTLALQGQFKNIMYRGGAGSDLSDLEDLGLNIVDNTWNVSMALSIPVFDGTRRKINLQKSRIQLEQLDFDRQNVDQSFELGVKTRINQLLSANTNIKYSEIAADNSIKSFDMVQNNYQQGVVPLASLIDAQNAALSAKLGHNIAIYDFLVAYIELEYSIGTFSFLLSNEQKENLNDRFMQYYQNNR